MRLQKRNILTDLILISLLIFIQSCTSDKISAQKESSGGAEKISDSRIWDMEITITNESNIKAKINAGYVERDYFANYKYSESRIDSFLSIDFYEKGKIKGTLDSKRGLINDLSEVFIASEDVVFRSLSGYTLFTDTLIWDRKKAVIYSDSKIMMVKDNRDTLYGNGFVGDDDFKSYQIRDPKGKALIENEEFN